MYNWTPIVLSLQLAGLTTLLLLVIGIPLAYALYRSKNQFKFVLEAIISLPLVLPPTVLGFYLLVAFSPQNALGKFMQDYLGLELIFSFTGLLVASVLYSLPFMVQPLQSGFKQLSSSLMEAGQTMAKSEWAILRYILLPNIKPAILSGIVLTFAHTMGEFGVVLMIGGKLPGETLLASIAVYDQVEALNYGHANFYAGILLLISFAILCLTYFMNRKL
jgi:molybdate transport system permease protein